jgi:hypothetical protein
MCARDADGEPHCPQAMRMPPGCPRTYVDALRVVPASSRRLGWCDPLRAEAGRTSTWQIAGLARATGAMEGRAVQPCAAVAALARLEIRPQGATEDASGTSIGGHSVRKDMQPIRTEHFREANPCASRAAEHSGQSKIMPCPAASEQGHSSSLRASPLPHSCDRLPTKTRPNIECTPGR